MGLIRLFGTLSHYKSTVIIITESKSTFHLYFLSLNYLFLGNTLLYLLMIGPLYADDLQACSNYKYWANELGQDVLLPSPTATQLQSEQIQERINKMPEFDRGMIVNNPVTTPIAVGMLSAATGYAAVETAPIIWRGVVRPNLGIGLGNVIGQTIQMKSDPSKQFNYFSLGASLLIPGKSAYGLYNAIGSGAASGIGFNNAEFKFDRKTALYGIAGNTFGLGVGYLSGARYLSGITGSTSGRANFMLGFSSNIGGSAFELGLSTKLEPKTKTP